MSITYFHSDDGKISSMRVRTSGISLNNLIGNVSDSFFRSHSNSSSIKFGTTIHGSFGISSGRRMTYFDFNNPHR